MIDWDEFERNNGTIDLKKLFSATHLQGTLSIQQWAIVVTYFKGIELIQQVKSREVAALAISQARILVQQDKEQIWQKAMERKL